MTITADMTVGDVIQQIPQAILILSVAGLDACCGAALPIGEAARRHGLDEETLLAEINALSGSDACQLSRGSSR